MNNLKPRLCVIAAIAIGVFALQLGWPPTGFAQSSPGKSSDPTSHAKQTDTAKDLALQLAELRVKVAKLEAAVAKTQGAGSSMGGIGMGNKGSGSQGMGGMGGGSSSGGGGMGGSGGGMSGMMNMMNMEMGGMGGGGSGSSMGGSGGGLGGMMDNDMDMMGMMGMGSMGGTVQKKMGGMKMAAALPGFPGASHLYHIGATGFFLDHPEHITLSTEQQNKLNRIKQKAVGDKATTQRKIDEAEQQLWELTAADEPIAEQIQSQIEAIGKLRGDQRLNFIRAVGEAAKVLADEQRQVLLGQVKPDTLKGHQPPSSN